MNQSEKDLLPARIGVTGQAVGGILGGLAVSGPLGWVLAGAGLVMAYAGNKILDSEARRMERERAEGKTPELPRIRPRGGF